MEKNIPREQLSGVFEAIREHLPEDFVCLSKKYDPADEHCLDCRFDGVEINISDICQLEAELEKLITSGQAEGTSNQMGDNIREITTIRMREAIADAEDLVPCPNRPAKGIMNRRLIVAVTLYISRWEEGLKETGLQEEV